MVDSLKGVAWITLLVIVGCSHLAVATGSQQCDAMQRVAKSAATSWRDAILDGGGDYGNPQHYCYSNPPCDEVTCILSRVRDRLRFILLRCSNPVALRVITESFVSLGKLDHINDVTFSKSVMVDFALVSGDVSLVMNVTMEHFSNAIGLQMVVKQTIGYSAITPTSLTFIPYTQIPFNSSSGCTAGPITNDINTQEQVSSDSFPMAAVIIPVICVLCMVVIALATIVAVVLLVRKKLNKSYGGRARAELAFQPLVTTPSDTDEEIINA